MLIDLTNANILGQGNLYLVSEKSGKSQGNLLSIICGNPDKSHPFYRYQKAVDAKKDRASKSSQSFGAKGQRGGHPSQVGSFANVNI